MATVSLTVARFTEEQRADWVRRALTVLSDAERRHLDTIRAVDARAAHAIGRAIFRLRGSCASAGHPRLLTVDVSEVGKPTLRDLPGLHLSVAHSGRVVVVGASPAGGVGVDIESAVPEVGRLRRLVERLFAPGEVAAARGLSDDALCDWFSSAWTIKEAVGKSLGVGMVPALSGVVVERRGDSVEMTEVWTEPPADAWTVHQLVAPGGREKIAVALPVRNVALDSVTTLTLEAFSEACSRADAAM